MGEQAARRDRAVEAFIAARQGPVLARAIADLSRCPVAELAAVTHRLSGTLGSYGLDEARHAVENLHDAVVAGPTRPSELAAKQAAAIADLERLAAATEGEGMPRP